jgi:hypothetical protein
MDLSQKQDNGTRCPKDVSRANEQEERLSGQMFMFQVSVTGGGV